MQIGVEAQRAVENKRVFVVDNDDVTSMALQFMLADENETHVLADVDAAIEKGKEWPPNLFLLGSGVVATAGARETVGRLKGAYPAARIVIVCDSTDEAAVKDGLSLGAETTLLRPLKLEAVRRKVDSQLGRRVELNIPVMKV